MIRVLEGRVYPPLSLADDEEGIAMRVNQNFILRRIADEYLLVPVGEAAQKVKGLISISESGYLLYQKLQKGCTREELIRVLLAEYDVSEAVAGEDVDAFLAKIQQLGMLEEAES